MHYWVRGEKYCQYRWYCKQQPVKESFQQSWQGLPPSSSPWEAHEERGVYWLAAPWLLSKFTTWHVALLDSATCSCKGCLFVGERGLPRAKVGSLRMHDQAFQWFSGSTTISAVISNEKSFVFLVSHHSLICGTPCGSEYTTRVK